MLLLQLNQARGQLGDLCSRLLAALRQLLQTIQYAPLHLQLLPTLAQSSLVALAQQGLQLALLSGLAGARILQPLQRVGLLHTELITLLLQGGELFSFLRHACVQCLLLLEQLPALIELHTPTTQKLAQAFPLRRSAHACVQRFTLPGQTLQLRVTQAQALLGIAAGQPELLVLALGAVALLLMQVIQHLLCLLPVLLRLLPGQIQRLQSSCRLTGGQALQFTGCLVTSLLGLLQSESRLLPLLLGLL